MDYKMSECFAALTGLRSFVEKMMAFQRNQLGAEITALKEELERTKAAATQAAVQAAAAAEAAAEATASEIKTLKGQLEESYKWNCGIYKEIAFLSDQAEGLEPNAEVAALLTQIGSIATFNSH